MIGDRKLKILVVDDDELNIEILNIMLRHDYEIIRATDGPQALEICHHTLPDLILLDVVMPGMNGHQVCQELKADPRTENVPVIFVTSQTNSDDETVCFDLGAVDFISKPLNEKVVRARVRTQLKLKTQNDYLESLALIDGLTMIANRRSFDEKLEMEWRHCRRNTANLSLILIDIDFFKLFNDCYGHQSGDRCLQSVAMTIKSCLRRPHDLVARYGGEEFVCVLPECDLAGAKHIAQGMCQAVFDLAIPHAMSTVAPVVTFSAGVSCLVPNELTMSTNLIATADVNLYSAKLTGRNRVICT